MNCYNEFPLSTVIYNTITLDGATVVGVVIVAQFGLWATLGYLLLLAPTGIGVMATLCTRCGYYGRRCALGLGKVTASIFEKGHEDDFFRTAPQFLAMLLLVLALILPIVGGIALLTRNSSIGRLVQLIALVGLLLAGLIPHPRLVCSHCCQGARGLCPVGRMLRQKPSTDTAR